MNTVTVSRTISASPAALREAVLDLEPFTRAAGFDSVEVDGRTIRVANQVGIAEIELELAVVDDPDATLAYEQREGIFEQMRTAFTVTPADDGAEGTANGTETAEDTGAIGETAETDLIEATDAVDSTSETTAIDATGETDATDVTATTRFALDVRLIGEFLDATVIERQRRKELNAQLDYLEDAVDP